MFLNIKKKEFYLLLDQKHKKKIPFFFAVDFLQKSFILKNIDDLNYSQDIIIDFPSFSNFKNQNIFISKIKLQPKKIYKKKFNQQFKNIHQQIQIGNSYLTNLTFEIPLKNKETLQLIFNSSKEKYKLLLKDYFICFSPETFIKIIDNQIFTYPMKGTIDASIKNAENILINNKKEISEHSTIVDLLRNDLNIVSEKVQVKIFRYIKKIKSNHKTILQTSSKIQGTIMKEYKNKIGSILQNLLPAGSISGAPKKKTVEIIQSTESYQRGFYTGIAGIFDGKNLDSCVLIRFIEKKNNKLFYKTGCGIHYLSNLKEEFQEIKNKIYVPFF